MRTIGRAVEIAWGLVWRSGTAVVALSLLAVMIANFQNDSPTASPRSASHADEENQGVPMKRVRLESAPVGVSHCILEGPTGDEFLEVECTHDESLGIRFGSAFPVQLQCVAAPDGTYSLNVKHRESIYLMKLRPDGVSGFTVTGRDIRKRRGIGLTTANQFVEDPRLIE